MVGDDSAITETKLLLNKLRESGVCCCGYTDFSLFYLAPLNPVYEIHGR